MTAVMLNEIHRIHERKCADYFVTGKKSGSGCTYGVCTKCGEILERHWK